MIQPNFLPDGLTEELLGAYIEGTLSPDEETAVAEMLEQWDGSDEFLTDLAQDLAAGPLTDDSVTYIDDADLAGFELPELPYDGMDTDDADDHDHDGDSDDIMDIDDCCDQHDNDHDHSYDDGDDNADDADCDCHIDFGE